MSDGPYKSLPLRRHWKHFAKIAQNAASSHSECLEALNRALLQDIKIDATDKLHNRVFDIIDNNDDLFGPDSQELDDAASAFSKSYLDDFTVDAAKMLVNNQSKAASSNGIKLLLADEILSRTFRTIDEHYKREGSLGQYSRIRNRMNSMRDESALNVISNWSNKIKIPTPHKYRGLDDGVSLQ